MQILKKLRRFLGREKEEEVEEKPEVEEKVEEGFPGISTAERKKHVAKHVAIVGGKIAASADTAKEALEMAGREHSDEQMELRYVASERLLIRCKCIGKD